MSTLNGFVVIARITHTRYGEKTSGLSVSTKCVPTPDLGAPEGKREGKGRNILLRPRSLAQIKKTSHVHARIDSVRSPYPPLCSLPTLSLLRRTCPLPSTTAPNSPIPAAAF